MSPPDPNAIDELFVDLDDLLHDHEPTAFTDQVPRRFARLGRTRRPLRWRRSA